MKTISKILIFVSMSLALSGCDDFLTKEPETNLSPNTFFSSEAELELWTNRFYSLFAGPDTDGIQVSDIQIAKNLSSVQQGTRSPATENWGTSAWAYLRYINYYLERSATALTRLSASATTASPISSARCSTSKRCANTATSPITTS